MKILVVDDTITYRQILSKVVAEVPDVELAGTASNGKIAVSKIEISKPDLILLDVAMPEMDGIETLDHIKKHYPDIMVVMVSGTDRENAGLTVKALQKGALDFVPKPQGTSPEESFSFLKASLVPIISLAITKKYSRQIKEGSKGELQRIPIPTTELGKETALPKIEIIEKPKVSTQRHSIGRIDVVAIGVSTGGPNALQEVVPKLNADLPVPIVVVQHMPPLFTSSLAERLDRSSKISVVEAMDGQEVDKGVMYLAPGGRHMVVRMDNGRVRIGLVDSPPVNSCRPAVDVLFRSVGMVYGGSVLSVILTGMGSDGAAGVAALRRKGAYCIVQDEKTSVVWGMPAAVAEANDADEIQPLSSIADRIINIVRQGQRRYA